MAHSKSYLAIALVVTAITLTSWGVLGMQLNTLSSQTSNTTGDGQVSCSTSFSSGVTIVSGNASVYATHNQTRTVFVMQPGTAGAICVTYSMYGSINSTTGIPTIPVFAAAVQQVTATPEVDAQGVQHGYTYSFRSAPGITTTSIPGSPIFNSTNNTWKITVVYTVNVSDNAWGFFNLEFTNQCPTFIPFAVVGASTELGAQDFQGFFVSGSCPLLDSGISLGAITGVSDMTSTEITD